jgi:hypothetical protein
MNTHADKIQRNKNNSVANDIFPKQLSGGSSFQLEDKRPEVIAQGKLQEWANNSPRAMQLQAFQDKAGNTPHAKPRTQKQAKAEKCKLIMLKKGRSCNDKTSVNQLQYVNVENRAREVLANYKAYTEYLEKELKNYKSKYYSAIKMHKRLSKAEK